jgi:hypothetical protein
VWNDPDGLAFSLLAGDAPESSGDDPYPWRVGKRVRYFKPRVRCSDACERAVLRSFEVFVRPSGRL